MKSKKYFLIISLLLIIVFSTSPLYFTGDKTQIDLFSDEDIDYFINYDWFHHTYVYSPPPYYDRIFAAYHFP